MEGNWKDSLTKLSCVAVGLLASSFINSKGKEAVNGLLGDETDTLSEKESTKNITDYAVPAVTVVGGVLAAALVDNDMVQSAGVGLASGGAISLVNKVAGKDVVTLSGIGESETLPIPSSSIVMPRAIPQQTPIRGFETIPGMGELIPGMGSTDGVVGCY